MSTLFVFGDSFAQDLPNSWTTRLASIRGMTLKNYGLGGSCLEYSFIKLVHAVDQIHDGDIVIFVLTHPGRLDLEHQITVDATSAYKVHNRKTIMSLPDPEFAKKYSKYRSEDVLVNKHLLHISFVKTLAQQHPKTKFLVVPAFPEVQQAPLITNTENFLFVNDLYLMDISKYEWDKWKINEGAIMDILGFDPRTNHLTNPNLQELAVAFNEVIDTWDKSKLYKTRFKKNVVNKNVSSVEEVYEHYVDTGLISREWTDFLRSSLPEKKPKPKKKWILF